MTPMLQAASAALAQGGDCYVAMLGSYKQRQDTLCQKQLDQLVDSYGKDKVSINYTFTGEETSADGDYSGRVNAEMLKACLPPPHANTRIFVSGPQGMLEVVANILIELGYDATMVIELEA